MNESRQKASELEKDIRSLPVFDTHEHIYQGEVHHHDVFEYFDGYIYTDLCSAGMGHSVWDIVQDASLPLDIRWNELSPFWKKIQHTGYARVLSRGLKLCFGVEEVDLAGLEKAQSVIPRFAHRKSEEILSEFGVNAGIFCTNEFPPFFHQVSGWKIASKVDFLIEILSLDYLDELTNWFGFSQVRDFGKLMVFHKFALLKLQQMGMDVIKSAQAYRRPIGYRIGQEENARKIFEHLVKRGQLPFEATIPLQDHLMDETIKWAGTKRMPVQIHTGIQAGAANIAYTRAGLLMNLILAHPQVNFCLFHASYPYWRELGAMAKNLPNVFIDMCWYHAISPESSQTSLVEWLGLMATNKLFGFGGDYRILKQPEMCVGHLDLSLTVISNALAQRVLAGWISEDQAIELARALLWDNPVSIYGVKGEVKQP